MRWFIPITLLWILMTSAAGCVTEFNLATGQEERLIYGTEKEVRIGDAVSRQLEDHYDLVSEIDMNRRAQRLLDRITAVADRKDLVYVIRIIDEDQMNAVSLPGGYIYLFRKLVEKLDDDDELAGVIAHEVGHITAKHGLKKLQASYGYTLLQAASIASGDPDLARGVSAIYSVAFFAYSREDEFQSDRLAVKYMKKAGFEPQAMVRVLEALKEESDKQPLRQISYFRTHPYIHERIAVVRQEITGEMDFSTYLDLTGND